MIVGKCNYCDGLIRVSEKARHGSTVACPTCNTVYTATLLLIKKD